MSPNDITAHQTVIAGDEGSNCTANLRKRPPKQPKETSGAKKPNNLRITTPLTPWREDESTELKTRRRSSLKSKTPKNKDPKKKEKRSSGGSINSRGKENSPKQKCSSFRYYPDIQQYMREYRHMREQLTAGHRDCSCHGTYGLEEVEKAYENLGLPKNLSYRLSKRDPWYNIASPAHPTPPRGTPVVDPNESADDVDSDPERTIASPEARKRRNNLNLSPLRKQVRLPDMKAYPVQSVSGLAVHDLVRLATVAGEQSRHNSKQSEVTSGSPKLRYTSYDKKRHMIPPLHTIEKTMCRVVELSLQDEGRIECAVDDNTKPVPSTNESRTAKANKRCESITDILQDSKESDDPLSIAIETSRSSQSSVLSTAISPLSSTHSITPCKSQQTIREMLSAAVKDLQPFSNNGIHSDVQNTSESTTSTELKDAKLQPRPVVSLKTFQKLGYKPSMRKFLHEIYSPSADFGKNNPSCIVSGKSLRTAKETVHCPVGSAKSGNKDLLDQSQQSICANRILKRVRQRHLAMENYDALRREMAIKRAAESKPKLAIFSKCQTAVKSQVTVKGTVL